ncbi:hypothetical protein CYMTET_15986 [Cymbomonas tetramitiformis]|uniref:Alpha/beta hydrolase fold-3 domain-containing protein n=1 Tax=Cymbomonas tetramitiformis TaxID=36881 RepID=A0AAE0GD99_9CHLO|nr:hypothetical protein CYMTET_15986 [Cymbomonas tetramitiformis]
MSVPIESARKMNLIDVLMEEHPDIPEPPEEAAFKWSEERIIRYFDRGGVLEADASFDNVLELQTNAIPWEPLDRYDKFIQMMSERLPALASYPSVKLAKVELSGAGPAGCMKMRVYTPEHEPRASFPAILYLMGGGYATCNLEERDFFLSNLARAGFTVLSVEYQTAGTGAVYPAANEDAMAALCWIASGNHGDELYFQSSRVVVMGDSAGGHLASVLPLMLLQRGGEAPQIKAHVLLCPGIDYGNASPDLFPYFKGVDHSKDQLANPLVADDSPLSQLPPVFVATAHDDEYEQIMRLNSSACTYASRLRDLGVTVSLREYYGKPRRSHVFMVQRGPWALDATVDIVEWLHQIVYDKDDV